MSDHTVTNFPMGYNRGKAQSETATKVVREVNKIAAIGAGSHLKSNVFLGGDKRVFRSGSDYR